MVLQISRCVIHSSRPRLRNHAKIQKFKPNSYALSTSRETSVIPPEIDSLKIERFSSGPHSHSSDFFHFHKTTNVETKAENTIHTYRML